jgi:hypothetical protein
MDHRGRRCGRNGRDAPVDVGANFDAFVARNGRSTFGAAELRPISPRDEKTAAKRIEASLAHESHVQLGGWLIANEQIATQVEKDLVRAELLAQGSPFPAALVDEIVHGVSSVATPPSTASSASRAARHSETPSERARTPFCEGR